MVRISTTIRSMFSGTEAFADTTPHSKPSPYDEGIDVGEGVRSAPPTLGADERALEVAVDAREEALAALEDDVPVQGGPGAVDEPLAGPEHDETMVDPARHPRRSSITETSDLGALRWMQRREDTPRRAQAGPIVPEEAPTL